jgi:hypothetical protein
MLVMVGRMPVPMLHPALTTAIKKLDGKSFFGIPAQTTLNIVATKGLPAGCTTISQQGLKTVDPMLLSVPECRTNSVSERDNLVQIEFSKY